MSYNYIKLCNTLVSVFMGTQTKTMAYMTKTRHQISHSFSHSIGLQYMQNYFLKYIFLPFRSLI